MQSERSFPKNWKAFWKGFLNGLIMNVKAIFKLKAVFDMGDQTTNLL